MWKVLFLPICLCLLAVSATAQNSGNYNKSKGSYNNANGNASPALLNLPNATWIDDKTMVLEINALHNKKADAQVAIFNITQIGQNAEEANRLLTERYKGFVDEVQSLGISENNFHLDMVSFIPIYEYEVEKKIFSTNYNEIPKGFEIQQNIHLKFKSSKLFPKIITIAAKYEIYDLVKVDYFVEDHKGIFQDLRKQCVNYLAAEVEMLIDDLGVGIDAAHRIVSEEELVAFPESRYSGYQAFTSSSLEGQRGGKVTQVRKPTTMFYDKVPYDRFEIIVNPTIIEPAVQFMYNIKIKFVVDYKPKTEYKKEFIWLTPEGEIKPLKVE